MSPKSLSDFFIHDDEQIEYSIGFDEKRDKLSSSSLVITQYFLYVIGKFLFRDSKMLFSETNGFKVIDLNSISAVTEIKKKSPILFSLFIIFLVVSIGLFISESIFPDFAASSNSNIELILLIMALIFLGTFIFLTKKMLHVEFYGGELLYDLNYDREVALKVTKTIFLNKKTN